MAANLKILGAAQTVTGSKYLISNNGFNLLIDCGLYQGSERNRLKEKDSLDFPASEIDAVVLTHAHLDHCGFIPRLVMDGFTGPIFATSATRDISRIILMDSAKIQLDEIKNAKKKNLSKRQIGEPLYYSHDVKFSMKLFRPLEYRDPLKLGPFEIILHQAGHVPGAASVGITWDSGSALFSGDLGRYNDLMTFDPQVTDPYENIIMESTYGGDTHSEESQFDALRDIVKKSKEKGGTLLVPAFSLSRSQLLLLHLKEVFNSYPELALPVYLNSPMANEVTEAMIIHNDTIKQDIDEIRDAFAGFHFIKEPWEAKSLYENNSPKIIISASGMMTGGRVMGHLKLLAGDDTNTIFVPGFQAPGTTGAELIAGTKEIEIGEETIEVKAEVVHSGAFSAHADKSELLYWLKSLVSPAKNIFIVHGEIESMKALKNNILRNWPDVTIEIPKLNDSFEI